MSLDLAVLDQDGKPAQTVSLGVEAHCELMLISKKRSMRCLLRLSDYYSDSEFSGGDLEHLREEVLVISQDKLTDELKGIVAEMLKLIDLAVQLGVPLFAIAD